jgi:hypothetical protein
MSKTHRYSWMEGVIGKPLPPVEDLDKELRNGIDLAYLAKEFKPDAVGKLFEVSFHKN